MARCCELTIRKDDSPHIDMVAVAEISKDRQIEGIDAGMLKAIAESDPVEGEGFDKQKGKPATNTCGPPTTTVTIERL